MGSLPVRKEEPDRFLKQQENKGVRKGVGKVEGQEAAFIEGTILAWKSRQMELQKIDPCARTYTESLDAYLPKVVGAFLFLFLLNYFSNLSSINLCLLI